MRISGGAFRGRRLTTPPAVRPTGGRVREALFSIWAAPLAGASFLDLYAGSGAVGLEALGRGAAEVVFVEGSARVRRALERNCREIASSGWRIVAHRLPGRPQRLAAALGRRFDLVFADPPYHAPELARLPRALAPLVAPGGWLAIEHSARHPSPPAGAELELTDRRQYGEAALSFYRRPVGEPD